MQTFPVKAEHTATDVVKMSSLSLDSVNTERGDTVIAQALIAKLLLDTTGYFGVAWSKQQITECAELWATQYHWMSVAEIKHFLTKVKTGSYSKEDFRHLSPFQLMGWLTEYTDELTVARGRWGQERERERIKQAQQARETDPNLIDVDFKQLIAAIKGKADKDPIEQDREDIALQKHRDSMVAALAQQSGIELPKRDISPLDVAEAIIAGDPIAQSPEYLQVQANNAIQVERFVKALQP